MFLLPEIYLTVFFSTSLQGLFVKKPCLFASFFLGDIEDGLYIEREVEAVSSRTFQRGVIILYSRLSMFSSLGMINAEFCESERVINRRQAILLILVTSKNNWSQGKQ